MAPEEPAGLPAADASRHRLRPDVLSLGQGVLIGLATGAPGQSTAVGLAAIVTASSYATGPAILLGMLPMLAIALCYRRLSAWEPNSGGPYVWVGRSLGPVAGFAVAWAMLVGFALGSASNLLPLGPSLLGLVGVDPGGVAGNVASATLLGGGMTVLAALGLSTTARFQLLIASIEYAILLAFCALGFLAVFVHHQAGTVAPVAGWWSLGGVGGKGSIATAMLYSVFFFTGWDAPVYLSEESRQRRRSPGRAAVISVLVLAVFYTLLCVCLQGVLSPAGLARAAASGDTLGAIGTALAGPTWGRLLAVAVVLSVLGTTQSTIVATSRVGYALAGDRLLPRPLAAVSASFGTPSRAALAFGAVSIAVADASAASSRFASAFAAVAGAEAAAFTAFYVAAALATAVWSRRLILRDWREALLAGVVPLAGAAALCWVLAKSWAGLGAATHWTLGALVVLGVVAMAVAAGVVRSPYFKLRAEAAAPRVD